MTTNLANALAQAASTVRTGAQWTMWLRSTSRKKPPGHTLAIRAAQIAGFPGARSQKLARVEAALFASGEPLTTRRIVEIANLTDGTEARTLIQELKSLYDADGTAFTVENIAGGWQLRTRPPFAEWLGKLQSTRQEIRLSQPALETLAVVAYRQPILRTDVEAVRGVTCGEMLRHLIDRGLVRIVGHHDSLGRPLLYGTTRRFLELFGLADLSDLPMAEQLRMPAKHKVPGGAAMAEPSDARSTEDSRPSHGTETTDVITPGRA